MATDSQKRARDKYNREKTKCVSIRFFPSDMELLGWLDEQPSKAGYIKDLIRADMEMKSRR